MDHTPEPLHYEAPTITLLGSVHALTQGHFKWLGESDGMNFIVPITNVSF